MGSVALGLFHLVPSSWGDKDVRLLVHKGGPTGCESPTKEVVGDVGSGLVSLYMKGTLRDKWLISLGIG